MTYVVHLEDDETLQEILKVAFQATDPKVNLKQFVNGDDVYDHIQPNVEDIDLYILDIRVPGSIDGMGVARKIRELGSDAPIIMTSAYRPPDRDVIDELSLEWTSKPWHIMEISERLIKLAKNRRTKAATPATAATPTPAADAPTSVPEPSAPVTVTPAVVTTPVAPPALTTPTPPTPVTPTIPITPSIKPQLTAAPPPPPSTVTPAETPKPPATSEN